MLNTSQVYNIDINIYYILYVNIYILMLLYYYMVNINCYIFIFYDPMIMIHGGEKKKKLCCKSYVMIHDI